MHKHSTLTHSRLLGLWKVSLTIFIAKQIVKLRLRNINKKQIDKRFVEHLYAIIAPKGQYRVVCNGNPKLFSTHKNLRSALDAQNRTIAPNTNWETRYSIFNHHGLCLS